MVKKLFDSSTRAASVADLTATVPDAASLFARAAAYLPVSPRFGAEHGYRVFWRDGGVLRFRDILEHARSFAVVGRHSRAHVRLLDDPTIALRHFVFRARRSSEGMPELHVADLLAPRPLLVDGSDEPQFACAVEEAFSARLGSHTIAAFPFDGCGRRVHHVPMAEDTDATERDPNGQDGTAQLQRAARESRPDLNQKVIQVCSGGPGESEGILHSAGYRLRRAADPATFKILS